MEKPEITTTGESGDLSPEREQKLSSLLHEIEIREGKDHEENGITVYEVEDPEQLFDWAVKNGFLLHGSPALFQNPEPRKSQDRYRPLGSLNAVYMSKYPVTSMAKTIIGNANGGYHIYRDETGKITSLDIHVENLADLNNEGYMYILDFNDHEDIADGDHVSFKPVKPYAVVKFYRKDFKYPIVERKNVEKKKD